MFIWYEAFAWSSGVLTFSEAHEVCLQAGELEGLLGQGVVLGGEGILCWSSLRTYCEELLPWCVTTGIMGEPADADAGHQPRLELRRRESRKW